MMPCDYVALDGSTKVLDLDRVCDIVNGASGKRDGWSALIVYDAASNTCVELRSSPPDIRGGSADEAEAVTEGYLTEQFGLNVTQLEALRINPERWTFIDNRSSSDDS